MFAAAAILFSDTDYNKKMERYEKDLAQIVKRCTAISDAASIEEGTKMAHLKAWDEKVVYVNKLFGRIHEHCDERDSQPRGERNTEDIMRDQSIVKMISEAADLLHKMEVSHKKTVKKVRDLCRWVFLL